jgi:arylsulfatase A-like enzyme
VPWRDVDLPAGYPEDKALRESIIDAKPRHWRAWYDGSLVSNYEAPAEWVPATLTPDQVREVNARNAVEVELIDEALGRVLDRIAERGWGDDVDVIFTTDHGELQGDFGFLFKGPYHVDALMRLPLVWRPAPSSRTTTGEQVGPSVVTKPVGLVDLAPTFCAIAGLEPAAWMEGAALPTDDADAESRGFERVLTEWDSELFGTSVHLRTIMRDNYVCTAYLPGTSHDGTEGELYDLADDPLQRINRWDDPAMAQIRSDLLSDLWDAQPEPRAERLYLEAPV